MSEMSEKNKNLEETGMRMSARRGGRVRKTDRQTEREREREREKEREREYQQYCPKSKQPAHKFCDLRIEAKERGQVWHQHQPLHVFVRRLYLSMPILSHTRKNKFKNTMTRK
jgi:hypothetical protein